MWKLIKKRLIKWSNIKDKDFKIPLQEYFSKVHFTVKYSIFQSKVDDYFYEKWKEIKHFFIYDDEKDYELNELISKTDDTNRKLELELIRCWLAYNKEDIFTFWKIFNDKLLYENIEYSLRKNLIVLFDEIIFEEKEWIEWISCVLYEKWWENEKTFKKILKPKDVEFRTFVDNLKENGLVKYYIVDEDKYVLKFIKEFKKSVIKEINNDESLKQKFQWLFTYKINSLKIEEWINNYVYWKNELDESISYEDLKYYIIWNIKDNHIQQNKIYLESSEEEVIWVLSKSKYETLFKKYKNIWDYLLYIKDGERDTKICRFTYKMDWKIENITNYKIFKEKILNNEELSLDFKNDLEKIFKKFLPIVWITVSWKQWKKTGTITPFFKIYEKIYNEWMWNILRKNDLHNLIILDYDFIWINIDFNNFESKIEEKFNEKTILTYEKRIKKRLWYCSTIYWYLAE